MDFVNESAATQPENTQPENQADNLPPDNEQPNNAKLETEANQLLSSAAQPPLPLENIRLESEAIQSPAPAATEQVADTPAPNLNWNERTIEQSRLTVSRRHGKSPGESKQPRVAIRQALDAEFAFRIDKGSGMRLFAPAGTTNPFELKQFTLTDDTINGICLDLAEAKVANSRPLVEQVICSPQVSLPINLPVEQLNYLEQRYDGKDHLSELIECCFTDSPVLFRAMFTKWLVGVVAQAFGAQRNEYAFVFVGTQGCGKTGFFERLLWHGQHYVAPATAFNFGNKEHMLLLASRVLILLDEMSAYGKKTDLDQLKAAFSLNDVTTDKKYQEVGTYPRRGSFAGTTNKQDFLRDVTGDRRFMVFELEKYDQPRFNSIDKMQLWGQLTRMHKQGFVTRLTTEEIEANMARNTESYSMEKTEDYFIEEHFKVTGKPEHFVTNRTMFELIDDFNDKLSSKTFGINRTTVAAMLKRLGVLCNQQGRVGGVNQKGYRGLQLIGDWLSDNPTDKKAVKGVAEHMRDIIRADPPRVVPTPEEAAAAKKVYDKAQEERRQAREKLERQQREERKTDGLTPDFLAKFNGGDDDDAGDNDDTFAGLDLV